MNNRTQKGKKSKKGLGGYKVKIASAPSTPENPNTFKLLAAPLAELTNQIK